MFKYRGSILSPMLALKACICRIGFFFFFLKKSLDFIIRFDVQTPLSRISMKYITRLGAKSKPNLSI